jgi:hypothetical protein
MTALLAITLLLLWFAFRSASWTGTAEEAKRMRDFRAAEEFFRRLLMEGASALDERWLPYILAFGLGNKLDQWYVAAPAPDPVLQPHRRIYNGYVGTDAAASPATIKAFQPAGGGFGGAGATGGWAQSIGSFAAAVPPPAPPRSTSSGSSSSRSSWSSGGSSSSSRSSGGSSSGGGGGGGW